MTAHRFHSSHDGPQSGRSNPMNHARRAHIHGPIQPMRYDDPPFWRRLFRCAK